MKTVLVTGGAGFIGSHIVDALITLDFEVSVVDNLSTGRKENINPKANFHCLEIGSPEIIDIFAKRKIDWVIHLAAQIDIRKSLDDPKYDAQVNVLGLLNVLELCRRYEIKGVIFASSGGAIYGEPNVLPVTEPTAKSPLSPYGVSKLTCEYYLYYYLRVYGLPYVTLRYGNVYGPRQGCAGEAGVISIFTSKMLSGETATIFGDGEQLRDYVFVEDAAMANILALRRLECLPLANSIDDRAYNIATGTGTSVNDLFAQLKKITGFTGKANYTSERKGELKNIFLDIHKAEKGLSWKPATSLSAGLKKTADYWAKSS